MLQLASVVLTKYTYCILINRIHYFIDFNVLYFVSVGYRFVVLFFNCMLTFGSYFCFDMPSVLQDTFTEVSFILFSLINIADGNFCFLSI